MRSTFRNLSFFILLAACTVGPAWAEVPEALLQAIDARSAEDRARDGARHPACLLYTSDAADDRT